MAMTVGQHDSAWLDVMDRQIPNGVQHLKAIETDLRISNQLRWLELVSAVLGPDVIKEEMLKSIGKQLGFTFQDEEDRA